MIGAGRSTDDRTIGNGRYALLQEIGWGGSGVVWRGEDRLIQRPVAIKESIMSRNLPEQQREVAMQRTLREVRATGQLNHPATLTIYDVLWGEEIGAVYIVMELVDGSSLRWWTRCLRRRGRRAYDTGADGERLGGSRLGACTSTGQSGVFAGPSCLRLWGRSLAVRQNVQGALRS